jgi:hypothetical protein
VGISILISTRPSQLIVGLIISAHVQALDSGKVTHDLTEFVINEGFERPEHWKYHVGVDLRFVLPNFFSLLKTYCLPNSVWYYSSMTPYAVEHANRGENPELATFIQKMMCLSKLPCDIIFVSDGDNRLHIKCDV